VSGAPDGPVAYVEVFEDGRLTAASWGPAEVSAVDVTINETYADAVAIARGELDLHVGFMQGRVKIVGPMGALMAVLPATQSEEHAALVQQLADQADR
jgi:putative sterol carrier protein